LIWVFYILYNRFGGRERPLGHHISMLHRPPSVVAPLRPPRPARRSSLASGGRCELRGALYPLKAGGGPGSGNRGLARKFCLKMRKIISSQMIPGHPTSVSTHPPGPRTPPERPLSRQHPGSTPSHCSTRLLPGAWAIRPMQPRNLPQTQHFGEFTRKTPKII
jgi:hypothetical protein